MTPTNIKHAVFETSRHADGSAKVQIVGAFGTFGIVVPAACHSEPMTEHQKIEALRNALSAMGEASELLKGHLGRIDPHGETPHKPEVPAPAAAELA
ncbi:hypothetical protein D3273_16665 [Lichenibacterium minor]|uniref:Uncharacterized protein n=1 Tax=Lichenibacterium minor TaxID=2316528 RepID=A0A4Q2U2V2_9HYPH|nr:hypothetical protein [Lichenibacterium minor]RYC30823.1 hypothetical protein D3273_16665 [Lichenibacterium minor]